MESISKNKTEYQHPRYQHDLLCQNGLTRKYWADDHTNSGSSCCTVRGEIAPATHLYALGHLFIGPGNSIYNDLVLQGTIPYASRAPSPAVITMEGTSLGRKLWNLWRTHSGAQFGFTRLHALFFCHLFLGEKRNPGAFWISPSMLRLPIKKDEVCVYILYLSYGYLGLLSW